MGTRTHYSLEYKLQVLAALDANDGNLFKTSRQYGIAGATLSDWNQRRDKLFAQGETLMQERRLRLGQRMELIINQIVDSLPKKIEKARLADTARTLSILIDVNKVLAAEQAAREAEAAEAGDVYERLAMLIQRYAPEHTLEMRALAAGNKTGDSDESPAEVGET